MIADILADKLVVSTSCSLMHTAVDLVNETKLVDEIKSWLAFAAQKINETVVLAKSLASQTDEVKSLVYICYICCNLKWKYQHLLYPKLLTF
jgi:5-methyltetrahydropteroyltriglutamate--homocysteine methyltransferase